MLANRKTVGEINAALEVNEDIRSPANGHCLTSSSLTNHKNGLMLSTDVSIDSAVTSVSSPFTAWSAESPSTPMTSPSVSTYRRNCTSSSMDMLGHNVTSSSALDGHVKSFPSLPVGHGVTPSSSISLGHNDTLSPSKFSNDHPKMSSSSMAALVDANGPPSATRCWSNRLGRKLARVFSPRRALDEICSLMFWHDVIVETVLCMYYECLIIWISVTFDKNIYKPSITHFGLYAGFFVFTCIEGWGPLCGASVNPARTWAVFLAGRMTFIKGWPLV